MLAQFLQLSTVSLPISVHIYLIPGSIHIAGSNEKSNDWIKLSKINIFYVTSREASPCSIELRILMIYRPNVILNSSILI